MKGTKMFRMVLAVAVMVFMIAPVVSAQTNARILDGKWFKVKLGLKGYRISVDGNETVLGKGAGSKTVYLHFTYNDYSPAPSTYTIATCTQDELNNTEYHLNVIDDAISINDIYGETYPQVWEFGGTPLVFYDGRSFFSAYPTFYTKITATDGTLKNASISNVVCTLTADLVEDEGPSYATGSCSLTGPLVLPAKVLTKVPSGCRGPL